MTTRFTSGRKRAAGARASTSAHLRSWRKHYGTGDGEATGAKRLSTGESAADGYRTPATRNPGHRDGRSLQDVWEKPGGRPSDTQRPPGRNFRAARPQRGRRD